MRREYLLDMGADELDDYARSIGLDVTGLRSVAEKADAISESHERVADMRVLGMTLHVPLRRLHDKRLTDLFVGGQLMVSGDRELGEVIRTILGDEQADALVARVTDEDGTVDNDALAFAFTTIMTADELKNS